MKLICRLLLALTLIPSVSASTQTSGAIEGVVVRAGTLEPISGVDLELTRLEEARTDVIGAGVVSQGSLRITFEPERPLGMTRNISRSEPKLMVVSGSPT